jgi:hypothetical protein
MKHLLNDLSQEEKNRILEQHSGGKIIDTSNFKRLLESKLGDSKPLVMEQQPAGATKIGSGTGPTPEASQSGGGGAKPSAYQLASQKWKTAIPNSTLYGVFGKSTPKYNYLGDGEIVVQILPNPVSKDLRSYLDNSKLMYLDYTYDCAGGGATLLPPTSRDDQFSQKLYKKGDMPTVSVSDPNVKGMITDYCKAIYPKITPVVGS